MHKSATLAFTLFLQFGCIAKKYVITYLQNEIRHLLPSTEMGVVFSSVWRLFFSEEEVKVIIVGLDNAGKTTTLYKLVTDTVVVTVPTLGSNVEEVTYNNIKFLMWDIGGQESSRASWSTYYQNTKVIILVIDSTDRKRIDLLKSELQKILISESLQQASLLVFANKQDLPGAMSSAEITEKLHLSDIKESNWHIQACCALTGEGLNSGLEWVAKVKMGVTE